MAAQAWGLGDKMPEKSALRVILRGLKVDSVTDCSGMFIGCNSTSGWSSVAKVNNGFGSTDCCKAINSTQVLLDYDLIDFRVIARFEPS
jgi:hypothetical protein